MTCVVSATLFFFISDFPEEVKWLTPEEKEFVKARLYEDVGRSKRHDPLTLRSVFDVFKDCEYFDIFGCPDTMVKRVPDKIIVGGFMYFGLIVPAYGYGAYVTCLALGLTAETFDT